MPQPQPQEQKTALPIGSPAKAAPHIVVPDAHVARTAQREAVRYASISSMQGSQKIDALKDLTLDPSLLSPQDAMSNILYRWQKIATSKEAQSATPEQKKEAAGNYFDHVIEPIYGELHRQHNFNMIQKDNWVDNAYTTALKWDIEGAYDTHWRSGLYSGFADLEQMAKTGFEVLGKVAEPIARLNDKMMGLKGTKYSQVEENKQAVSGVTDYLSKVISHDTFWHDINPNTTAGQTARAVALEQLVMLPIYRATGGFTAGTIAGFTGREAAVPLTQLLSRSEIGHTATKLLLNGSEGAVYGYTMSNEKDRASITASGAIQQAILGTIFHTKFGKIKLSEAVPPERAAELAEAAEKAEMATKGWTHGDVDALTKNIVQSFKGVSLAGGRPALSDVLSKAFAHVAEIEGPKTPETLAEMKAQMRENMDPAKGDPVVWKSIYSTARWIESILNGRKLSSLTAADKEEPTAKLKDAIGKSDALAQAEEEETERQIKQAAQTPQGQKVVKEVGAETYVAANKKAAAKAVQEISKRPVDEALDIAKRRADQVKNMRRNKEALTIKVRTSGSGKNRMVAISPDWNVYAGKAAKAAGFGSDMKKWLDQLPHEEFAKDLYDFFYPESLKQAGLDTFESEHVKNMGSENPNFLAFMYNFRDRMPPMFRNKLREELIDSDKVTNYLDHGRLDEPQLQRYALGMKAHVDELLTNEKFKNPNIKGETGNAYRTTYETMDEPTEYQLQLHDETIDAERGLIQEMFSGRPEELQQALTTYNLLASERVDAFIGGNQKLRVQKNAEIDGLLVQLSGGTRVKWEY